VGQEFLGHVEDRLAARFALLWPPGALKRLRFGGRA
jgi:hypothetical protein